MRYRHSDSIAATSSYELDYDTTDGRGFIVVEDNTSYFRNHSEIADDLHPGWRRVRSGDSGGPLELYSTIYSNLQPAVFHERSLRDWGSSVKDAVVYPDSLLYVKGSGLGYYPNAGEVPPAQTSKTALIGLGTSALSRTLPTNPAFGLSRAIGELRNDGLPAIVGMQTLKEKSHYLRNSGSEYLNVQFGWLPLISDLLGFARSVKTANKTIAQFRKSSDAKLRRKYVFPTKSTTWSVSGVTALVTQNVTNEFWTGAQSVTSLYETSFSGAFRYHLPIGDDFPSKMMQWESEANKLLGLRLTPKLVFDLAPWTWATGWFSNLGDIMNNVSRIGADGLVVEYGYIMDKLEIVDDLSAWCSWRLNENPLKKYYCSRTLTTKRLRRYNSTAYGFNFDIHSLSATQDAILVALGLSHGLR